MTLPSPLNQQCPQCSSNEQKWVCLPHGILQLPRNLIQTKVLALHLYQSDGSIIECSLFPAYDANMLHLELSLGFHLNHIPINNVIMIMYILFKQRDMKNIMSFHMCRQCNPICNQSYPIKDIKRPAIYWCQLSTTSEFHVRHIVIISRL